MQQQCLNSMLVASMVEIAWAKYVVTLDNSWFPHHCQMLWGWTVKIMSKMEHMFLSSADFSMNKSWSAVIFSRSMVWCPRTVQHFFNGPDILLAGQSAIALAGSLIAICLAADLQSVRLVAPEPSTMTQSSSLSETSIIDKALASSKPMHYSHKSKRSCSRSTTTNINQA